MKYGDKAATARSEVAGSWLSRLLATVGGSAEYAVAAALLSVCVIVGVAFWLMKPRDTQDSAAPVQQTAIAPSPTAAPGAAGAAKSDEQAAIKEWQKRLTGSAAQAEARRKQQLAQDEQRRREALAERERAAQVARTQAEREKTRKRAAENLKAASTPAKPASASPAPAVAAAAPAPRENTVVATARRSAPSAPMILTPASLDQSSCKQPAYPSKSKRLGEEGTVVLQFDVDAQGAVTGSRVAESSSFEVLDRTALESLSKCRFRPATRNGVAEVSTTQIDYVWRLR